MAFWHVQDLEAAMATRELSLPIQGMTCASCVMHVENALKEVPGVLSVAVNLATERAAVGYDPDKVGMDTLVHAVQYSGYDVPQETIVLPIEGMTCASCVMHVENALKEVPGVLSVVVNLATERAPGT
jgi:copper ion binding protein